MSGVMRFLSVILIAMLSPYVAWAASIIGGEIEYVVKKGDTLQLISSRVGVAAKHIAESSGIDPKKPLQKGQILRINTTRIVPKEVDNGVIINIPDRTLYLFRDGAVSAFPVGLGMPSWRGLTRWRTPTGEFTVLGKQKDPTWFVPESMQWKMQLEGKEVKKIVPPGPENPLGRFAVKTSIPGILIHETLWPTSVYRFASHGCVRMLPEHMERLFGDVQTGTSGEILYMPVKVGMSPQGRAFLEVHRDVYDRVKDPNEEVRRLVEQYGVSDKVDWNKIEMLLKEQPGIAKDITL